MADLSMAPAPGKFEGELLVTQLAYEVALNGGADEEAGACSLLRDGSTIFLDGDPFGEEFGLSEADRDFLREQAGVVIRVDDNGFVYGTWHAEEADLARDWDGVLEAHAEYEAWQDCPY